METLVIKLNTPFRVAFLNRILQFKNIIISGRYTNPPVVWTTEEEEEPKLEPGEDFLALAHQ
jgi:hypothetical protein